MFHLEQETHLKKKKTLEKKRFAENILEVVRDAKKKNKESVEWKDHIKGENYQQSEKETDMWTKVQNDLLPIDLDIKEKHVIRKGLNKIRIEACMVFVFLNASFIIIVFFLQMKAEEWNISVSWPLCKISTAIINSTGPSESTTTLRLSFVHYIIMTKQNMT